jgi:hypothetical protein
LAATAIQMPHSVHCITWQINKSICQRLPKLPKRYYI